MPPKRVGQHESSRPRESCSPSSTQRLTGSEMQLVAARGSFRLAVWPTITDEALAHFRGTDGVEIQRSPNARCVIPIEANCRVINRFTAAEARQALRLPLGMEAVLEIRVKRHSMLLRFFFIGA